MTCQVSNIMINHSPISYVYYYIAIAVFALSHFTNLVSYLNTNDYLKSCLTQNQYHVTYLSYLSCIATNIMYLF